MYERVVSERELNPHGCDLRLHRPFATTLDMNPQVSADVMCPRGDLNRSPISPRRALIHG
jgi:hypothetical protein